MTTLPELADDEVTLPGGPRLALRRADGPGRPFVLVHGLASNARLWDGVARRLAAAGHAVVAVDQRGHGRSEETADGYDTDTCATDLAKLAVELGLTGASEPVVAGQSWGGNVVLTLAARHGGVAAAALVDGGWLRLADRFPTFEECWSVLAPPDLEHLTMSQFAELVEHWHADWPAESRAGVLGNLVETPDGQVRARLRRDHHRSILHSMWLGDPRSLYGRTEVPVLLAAAVADPPSPDEQRKRVAVTEALQSLPDAEVVWYVGAHHDLHAQHPDRLAGDLLALAARAEGRR